MTVHLSPPEKPAERPPLPGVVLGHAPPVSGKLGWFFRHVPAFDSLRRYSWAAFAGDLSAGFTVATVAVPQAMAYATLAGVPPLGGGLLYQISNMPVPGMPGRN